MVVFLLVLVIVILISSNYCLLWRRKWLLTPVFLSGKSMDRVAWQATVQGVSRVGHYLATAPPLPLLTEKL